MNCKFWLDTVALSSNNGFSSRDLNRIRVTILDNYARIVEAWDDHCVETREARIASVDVSDDLITADLVDGRVVSVPLAWSWRLSEATHQQRQNFEIIGDGEGVHWPDVDEDISARGMLQGVPARPPREVVKL